MFFECSLASKLWNWLASTINLTFNFSYKEDIWKLCDRAWSSQCKLVIKASLVNLLNIIWYARNQSRFHHNNISWKTTISMICALTSLSGNYTSKASNNSIVDFSILKAFNCKIHHPKAPQIREVIWYPPHTNWLKWNIDGASNGNLKNSACGGILRDHNANFILCFAEPLCICSSYQVELCAFMRAVGISHQHQWHNVWIETDSSLVVQASKSSNQVPWRLRNHWNNVKTIIQSFNCIVSHVFREGNQVADSLANHGLSLNDFSVWNEAPLFISSSFFRDKEGRSNFRFFA